MQTTTNNCRADTESSLSEAEAAMFFEAIRELDYNKVSWYCNEQTSTSGKELSNGTNFAKLRDSQTGQTALHIVCNMVDDGSIRSDVVHKKLQIIKLLLAWGADVMDQEKNGHTPIELAIKTNQLELVQFLSNMDQLLSDYNIKISEAYLELALNYAENQNNLRCYTHLKNIWLNHLEKKKGKKRRGQDFIG
jgi:ankyrin repeat protein